MTVKNSIPRHVAIIMDGNGRWAKQRGLSRALGHREGFKRVKEIIKACAELKIEVVTFFTFSTENWSRPKQEVDMLMRYLLGALHKEVGELIKNNIRLMVIGRDEPMPQKLTLRLKEAQERTRMNTALTVVLALNYGSRQEIVDAAKKIAEDVLQGKIEPGNLKPDDFSGYLYTAGLPDPDIMIRTSGEMRLSNFMLWQLSYAELYFAKKYWPDFKRQDLEKAIRAYGSRGRRYGGINVG